MENTNKERQVWQRVMAPAQSWAEADWQQLLNPAAQSAGAYRYLMGALSPEHRSVAARLYRESLETLACLKGLCRLQGQHPGRVQPVPVGRETVDQVLIQSYHRARKAAAEYTAPRTARGRPTTTSISLPSVAMATRLRPSIAASVKKRWK